MAQNDFDLTVMQREILDVIEPAIVGLSSELSAYGHSGRLGDGLATASPCRQPGTDSGEASNPDRRRYTQRD